MKVVRSILLFLVLLLGFVFQYFALLENKTVTHNNDIVAKEKFVVKL
jgi:hypothetical protein